jgi:hypothetical protein
LISPRKSELPRIYIKTVSSELSRFFEIKRFWSQFMHHHGQPSCAGAAADAAFADETREGAARGAIRALKRGQPPERRSLAITHYPPTRPGFIMAVNQVLTSLKRQQF